MKRFLLAGLLCLLAPLAHAQDALVVLTCGTLPLAYSAGATRQVTVDVNGRLCSSGILSGATTITALPTCNAAARALRFFVTDGQATTPTYQSLVTGSGSTGTWPVVCDGSSWRYD